MNDRTRTPIILMDSPDDGYCEERGWVEAIVDEDTARDLLAPFCFDEDGNQPARPTRSAERVYLAPELILDYEYGERWVKAEKTDEGAREFFKFDATDTEPDSVENRR